MNYNDNGTIKQITVKAADTLPVGTEVDVPLETTTPSGYEDVSTMLVENASIQVAGQLDLQNYGITNEYFVLSAYAPGYVLIPFVYGARWFLKVLDTSLSPVSAGTSITFTLKYEKSSKKIKKTYNGVVPNGKLLNSYSTSQNDGYNCKYINGLGTYSTDEKRIGTWIDGKPLYRKVVQDTTNSTTAEKNITCANNVSEITKWYGDIIFATNSKLPLNYYVDSSNFSIAYADINSSGNGRIRVTTTQLSKPVVITMEYTKTTD